MIIAATVVYMALRIRKRGKGQVSTVLSGISSKAELDAEVHEIFEAGSENAVYEVHG